MEQQSPTHRYITTTLPYVNDKPHMGHALEFVQADALARAWRLLGDEVFFTTGTDEHGQKIAQKAAESGCEVQEYVDDYAARFKELHAKLNLSNDAFVRTTDPAHKAAAGEMWRRCMANVDEQGRPDIYRKKYKGLYCVGDEMFMKENDVVDGKCPNHPTMPLQEIEEENYFFRLSRYQHRLTEYLSREEVIMPESRRKEALAFVAHGLEDFSISREKARMSWGIPVPNDESQVMYVWFDALTNYISTLGWGSDDENNFKKFWEHGETLQLAGKDQVRFQSIMWQAMLMSAKLPTTNTVFYHGFLTSGGQKMSKSIGNVIDPVEVVDLFKDVALYPEDVLRFVLLHDVSSTEDSDITLEGIKQSYAGHLQNGLGNLVSRIMKMATQYLTQTEVQAHLGLYEFSDTASSELKTLHNHIATYRFDRAMQVIVDQMKKQDELIAVEEPFKVIKINIQKGKEMILNRLQGIWRISVMLQPFLPRTATEIQRLIREHHMPEKPLFGRLS